MISTWALVIFAVTGIGILFMALALAGDAPVFACIMVVVGALMLASAWHDYGYSRAMMNCGYEWVAPCEKGKWAKKP